MVFNGRRTVSKRLLYKLTLLTFLIIIASILFFYESAKERYYAEVVNYSGKVRGGIQRVVKLYFAKDFSTLKEAESEVEKDLKVLERDIDYIKLPIVDWDRDFSPKVVVFCWKELKEKLVIPPTPKVEKEVLYLSEDCWKKADTLTDFYEAIVSRNLFVLNLFYALVLGSSLALIFLLGRIVVVDINRRLERRANFDPLTGALNRGAFLEMFDYISSVPLNYPLGLIIFDLDDFKKVNDTYGHKAGDIVLQEVAKAVRRNIRKSDLFVRWGGEEFVVLLPRTDLKGAEKVAEKLRKAIESLNIEPYGVRITASFGVTEILPGETLDNALERADKALYKAKNLGKNRVEVETPKSIP
ncbi:MAG TPA: GGDEF domain-containing protein [Aquificales bacterium]|nr:GGDEF domain-containing protein [Aquificales bacterium]